MRAVVLVLLLLLTGVAAADAAYAPQLTITVADGAPGGPAAVTATLTQSQGEEPTRVIETTLPGTFGFNPGFVNAGCSAADEAADTCPEAARIGRITATSPFGEAEGALFLTEDFRLLARLEAYAGLVRFRAAGILRVLPGQRVVVRFGDLPPIPSTALSLVLEGGERTPLALPRDCGSHVITSRLESAATGRVVEGEHPVVVRGCSALPRVRSARVDGRVLRWRATRGVVRTEVALLRLRGGKWRPAGARRVARRDRLRIGRLAPGRYRAELTAIDGAGRRSIARVVAFSVRR